MSEQSMDNLLDGTLDDIADLPEFKNFEAGAHRVTASWSLKEIDNHGMCPEVKFVLVETMEKADEQAAGGAAGDECSALFMLDNEFGAGKFKANLLPFAEALGLTKPRDIIEAAQDVDCVIITGLRTDKKNPDKVYLDIKEIQVVG